MSHLLLSRLGFKFPSFSPFFLPSCILPRLQIDSKLLWYCPVPVPAGRSFIIPFLEAEQPLQCAVLWHSLRSHPAWVTWDDVSCYQVGVKSLEVSPWSLPHWAFISQCEHTMLIMLSVFGSAMWWFLFFFRTFLFFPYVLFSSCSVFMVGVSICFILVCFVVVSSVLFPPLNALLCLSPPLPSPIFRAVG